jgi:hypothetical protein
VVVAQVVLMRERYRRWEAEVAIYHESQRSYPTNYAAWSRPTNTLKPGNERTTLVYS